MAENSLEKGSVVAADNHNAVVKQLWVMCRRVENETPNGFLIRNSALGGTLMPLDCGTELLGLTDYCFWTSVADGERKLSHRKAALEDIH